MASVLIPILAGLEPLIAPLIIKIIDKIFPPKSGAIKFPTVQSIFQAILDGLAKAGQTGVGIDQPTLAGWIQELVNELNKSGELKGPATVIALPTGVPAGLSLDNGIAILQWLKTMPVGVKL